MILDRDTTAPPKKGNSFLRFTRRLTLAFAMAVGVFSSALSAQAPGVPAAPEHPEIVSMKAEFNRTALGRELLQYAAERGIKFRMDATMSKRTSSAEYDPTVPEVLIKPGLELEQRVVYTAHEIRHGWQDKTLGYPQMEAKYLTPHQRWVIRRFLEADAAAYSAFFAADRMHRLDLKDAKYGTADEEKDIAKRLEKEFTSEDGLTGAEYLRIAFEPTLGNIAPYYTNRHLDLISDLTIGMGSRVIMASNAIAKKDYTFAAALMAPVMKGINEAPDDAAVAAWVRRMGGTSFDPLATTPLQAPNISDNKLSQEYAFRLANPGQIPVTPLQTSGRLAVLEDVYRGYIRMAKDVDAQIRARITAAAPAPKPVPVN